MYSHLPHPACIMTRMCNFIEDLLRGSVSVKEAKILADSSFFNKSFKKRVLFKILKQIKEVKNMYKDQRKFNPKRSIYAMFSSQLSTADKEADYVLDLPQGPSQPLAHLLAQF